MRLKNGLVLNVERAKVEDAKGMIEYLNRIGGESDNLLFSKDGFHLSVQEEEKFIENINNTKTSILLVSKINDEIVSIASLISPTRERISHLSNIAISVSKKYWGIGIGTHVMKELINFARDNGITKVIRLEVRTDNESAIGIYSKLGFEVVGICKNFMKVNGEYHDVLLMNLYL